MPLVYVKNAKEIKRAVLSMERGARKSRRAVQAIFKQEMSSLLPRVRSRVSIDTGLLRRSLGVNVDTENFSVTMGYRIRRQRFASRRIPAILEEYGGAGQPPRSRALTRAFGANESSLVNRLIQRVGDRLAESMERSARNS